MKYKAKLYFRGEKICEGEFNVPLTSFSRESGTSYSDDGFSIKYTTMKTKRNKVEEEKFLKKYPTPESFYGEE